MLYPSGFVELVKITKDFGLFGVLGFGLFRLFFLLEQERGLVIC